MLTKFFTQRVQLDINKEMYTLNCYTSLLQGEREEGGEREARGGGV